MKRFRLRNYRIATRIALALALPMAGMLALSIWFLSDYYRMASDMERLRKLTGIEPEISALAHALQLERGVSVSYIGSEGTVFASRLPTQQRETDAKRADFNRALERNEGLRFGGNLENRIATTLELLNGVDGYRRALETGRTTAPEFAAYYGNVILELIGIIEEMRLFGTGDELTRTISASTVLMHAKELAGLERATGAAGFAAGHFSQETRARIVQLIERQRLQMEAFWLFASKKQTEFLDRAFADFNAGELDRMRQVIIQDQNASRVREVGVDHWFDITTQKIDRLKMVGDALGADLLAQVARAEASANRTAWQISGLVLLLLAVTTALATAIARSIIRPLTRITQSMGKLAAAQNDVIEMDDDQRGDEIGDMARALVVFQDGLRKVAQTEERLKSAALLRVHHEALGAISQAVLITDAQHRITYANPAFLHISGYSGAEILGQTPAFLHNKGGLPNILAELRDALSNGRHFHGHLLNYKKDGTPFWSDLSVNSVLDNRGQLTHFVGVSHDITENRLMQEELRIAATAFESLHGIMVTDASGKILRVNRAFTELTGYSAEEVIGQTPALLNSGRHPPEFFADMWRQLSETGAWYGEIWDRRKNGEIFPKWQTISAVRGVDEHTTHYVAAFSDISENKTAEDEIKHLAFYDPLTQLPNRRLLLDRLQHAMAASMRSRRYGALLFIDLDNFKNLNDTFGHDKGDLLLQQVAIRLKNCMRDGDTVARLGGDEFVLILEDLSENPSEAATRTEMVSEKILEALNAPYLLIDHEYHSTPSIGATLYCGNDFGIDDLLKQADLAMYQAKAAGRNAMRFFQPDMQTSITARSELESDLRKGLRDNQFQLYYQPQVTREGRLTGAEALLRWQHPTRGLVSPNEFMTLAEETGLILPLGQWVLEEACRQLVVWAEDPETAALTIAVNVSARQFSQTGFVGDVLAALASTGANPCRLKMELTESLFLSNVDDTISKMASLKVRGLSFSLDDFGTGYSSLSYLKRLPLNQLKIDQSFVKDLLTDPNDAAIAKMVIALATSMGLEVIAEGVEIAEQWSFLAKEGCHAYQGYLYARPLPLGEFEAFVERTVVSAIKH